jgi:hypothetical protein
MARIKIKNEYIEEVLKGVFPDFKTKRYPGVPLNSRFERIESLEKDFANGGNEVYFKDKLYELVETVYDLTKKGLLMSEIEEEENVKL